MTKRPAARARAPLPWPWPFGPYFRRPTTKAVIAQPAAVQAARMR
jgi:hypothetical protein